MARDWLSKGMQAANSGRADLLARKPSWGSAPHWRKQWLKVKVDNAEEIQ
jgi:hypothetical protein